MASGANHEQEVRLEGFAENLKGHRIYCVGSPNLLPGLVRSRIAILDTETAHRGRKVLFLNEGSAQPFAPWLLRMKWDAVFVIHDTSDLRLGLTYVTNAARPVRLVWAGGEPNQQVFAALARTEGLSILGFGLAHPNSQDWDAVFWTHDTTLESIEPCLHYRLGPATTDQYNLRHVLREIAANEVGLVWSRIGDKDRRGSLYWFDPSEGSVGTALYTTSEAADLLRSIADSLATTASKR